MSGPSQERISLRHHPIQSSVEMDDDHGSDRRLRRDQSGIGCRGCYSLVDEGHTKECSFKRSEERESRHGLLKGISPSHTKDHTIFILHFQACR